MSSLASLLLRYGYAVTGSDAVCGSLIERLRRNGAFVETGEARTLFAVRAADVVVYTDAVAETDEERLEAERAGKIVYARADFLRLVSRAFPYAVSVAGSHGKTTCTAMCAHILRAANAPFTAHIGGEDCAFSNFYSDGTEYFVTEACEYKKNLLKICADTRILLNIDYDHMECYGSEDALVRTFLEYCAGAKTAVVCADDKRCEDVKNAVTFGVKNPCADYLAVDVRSRREQYSFTVKEYGKPLCRVRLSVVGKCHVYNALAAFAAMRSYGFSEREICQGLRSFQGVKRRFEKMGTLFGAAVVCDYAHHPKEIVSTVLTAKKTCKGNLFVVFQPHTYSRTKTLMNDFVECLKPIERLLIYKTFPAREKYDEEGCAKTLAERVGCLYADTANALKTWLARSAKENDCVLFLGAGDVYYLAEYLVKEGKME